jgi:hypothetical protein
MTSKIAKKGNGQGKDCTPEEHSQCDKLAKEAIEKAKTAWEKEGVLDILMDFCDAECARRYLVARTWNYSKALAQLEETLKWRLETKPWKLEFKNSPKCIDNPFALCMRIVGIDDFHRPVIYTAFSQANDRWDLDSNMTHLLSLLEAAYKIIVQQFRAGVSEEASSLQWVWNIDFHGYAFRDQSPRNAVATGHLMAHYPEMLHLSCLIDGPILFRATWSAVNILLDDRVRQKVAFVNKNNIETVLTPRIGERMAKWLACEMDEVRKKQTGSTLRAYWIPPTTTTTGGHDPRGDAKYVESPYYVETPGDAFEKRKKG